MNIGVLALQGGVIEHLNHIKRLGQNPIEVKDIKDLEIIDGLILPGGESTAIGKLLDVTGLMEPIRKKIMGGLPTWGTCAGMILLAKDIEGEDRRYLEGMNITVKRNAFGTQIDSFKSKEIISEISGDKLELVFIRAPYITNFSNNVEILCKVREKIVAVKENNILATSFHPELTEDTRVLEYFINKFIMKSK